jgi:hypothetical protein
VKLVGSRPAILAIADGLMSKRLARASIAVQISVWESAAMGGIQVSNGRKISPGSRNVNLDVVFLVDVYVSVDLP